MTNQVGLEAVSIPNQLVFEPKRPEDDVVERSGEARLGKLLKY